MNEMAFLSLYAVFFAGLAAVAYWATTLDRPARGKDHPAPGE
ncbi:MAG: hypothetical protein K0R85_753 [Devosia sp.]|jgi:hypothetical protein|nr:hypothetical protein [Devosia sp.]